MLRETRTRVTDMEDYPSNNQSFSKPGDCTDITDLREISEQVVKNQYFYSPSERLVILVFYPILLSFGLIGNLAFLVVVAKIPSMRTITNFYLVNIAVSDLLFIVTMVYDIFIGYLLSPDVRASPYYTTAGCITVNAATYISHFASVFLILLVSTERYFAICKTLKHRSIATKSRTVKFLS